MSILLKKGTSISGQGVIQIAAGPPTHGKSLDQRHPEEEVRGGVKFGKTDCYISTPRKKEGKAQALILCGKKILKIFQFSFNP